MTIWEDALRGPFARTGLTRRWVGAVFYWNAPAWLFTVLYLAFGALVGWTWVRIPPRRRRRGTGVGAGQADPSSPPGR